MSSSANALEDSHAETRSLSAGNGTTATEGDAETAALKGLDTEVRDQDDLERTIGREADQLLLQQANQRDEQRLEKTVARRDKLQSQARRLQEEISRPIGLTLRNRKRNELQGVDDQIIDLEKDAAEIRERIAERASGTAVPPDTSHPGRLPTESQRDFLIRTGKITPFSRFGLSAHGESSATLRGALFDAEDEPEGGDLAPEVEVSRLMSHRNLRQPGFVTSSVESSDVDEFASAQPRKRRRLQPAPRAPSDDEPYDEEAEGAVTDDMVSMDEDSETMPTTTGKVKRAPKRLRNLNAEEEIEDLRNVDDGNEALYRVRLHRWARRRRRARRRHEPGDVDEDDDGDNDEVPATLEEECHLPHPQIHDTVFDGGYKIPGDIYPSLFDYQKTGVQWLHELYTQQVGGIIGDEMGLGKTIQIIALLAGLQYSKKLDKPVIVVCPATVMKQWVNEFHRWWPPFRVTILHSSGSGMINVRNESSREDRLMDQLWDPNRQNQPLTAGQKSARKVLKPVLEKGGVLVTTYSGLQSYAPLLIPVDWAYAILDEGHKIRNPNTAITIYCKELRTPNRIILSGTPMQNNLVELWSLFDFVFPMRLGTLVSFRNEFDIPIRQGGYANASNLQVQTAYKCAEILKDAISPYLLQRFKVDVAADLPKKSEQVLFCKLTKRQRKDYESFLASSDMDAIMLGKRQVLYGIDILRKICNHPDLQGHKTQSAKAGYGDPVKSGKMQVVGSLLELWRDTGHKALLFAQHRIMLDILEKFVRSIPRLKHRRMDGNTPIQTRQSMVDEFNTNDELHVFLLTTKVGGLGVNLTGADRVIIFDPDWNPSTDLQARERAWRLGQKREVSIYRLMTAGTIEEKIYHRQIFKQFLTNKVLKDPKQRQTFHLSDLHDLFTLGDEGAPTETSNIFRDAKVNYSTMAAAHADQNADSAIRDAPAQSSADVSVETLPGISTVERYAGEVAEEEQANKDGAANSDARVMEGIFSKSNIHSAVEHEAILSGNGNKRKVVADPVMVEQEAKRVAALAAQELRRAGDVARSVPAGTVTWTGQFGVAGRPQETTAQRAFGASSRNRGSGVGSASLLAGLQQRNHESSRGGTPRTSSPARSIDSAGTASPPSGKEFGKLIRDYLSVHGGSAYTQNLIDHFNRYCATQQATLEFKETLKAIARLEKGSRGRGQWVLKDEYKR